LRLFERRPGEFPPEEDISKIGIVKFLKTLYGEEGLKGKGRAKDDVRRH
jgi:hypothetical protein